MDLTEDLWEVTEVPPQCGKLSGEATQPGRGVRDGDGVLIQADHGGTGGQQGLGVTAPSQCQV